MKCMILKCIFKCITSNCKPTKNFDFQKTKLFGLKSFHGFAILDRCKDGTYCLSSVLFGHTNINSQYFCERLYQTWPAAVVTLKKHQTVPTRTHKKRQISDF